MPPRFVRRALGCGAGLLFAATSLAPPALAQREPLIAVDLMTDYRVRGLGWSDGETAGQVYVDVPLAPTLSASAQATTLRGSNRHGGADLGLDLTAAYSDQAGLINWYGTAIGHVFPGGEGNLDYGEVQAGIGGAIGPVDVNLLASYAPPQDAIGGSNFYRRVEGRLGIWGTPFSVRAHLGRSSGDVDDRLRSERLRPGGAYTDWEVGAEYHLAPMAFSLTYSDTDISRDDIFFPEASRHYGAKIVAGAQVSF